MSRSNDDIHGYLTRLGRRFEQLDDGTFLIASRAAGTAIALRLAPPVVVARIAIGELPPTGEAPLMRRMLELNATGLVHAAYGLEGNTIQLSSAVEADNLDLNELEAVLEDLDLALADHVPALRELSGQGPTAAKS